MEFKGKVKSYVESWFFSLRLIFKALKLDKCLQKRQEAQRQSFGSANYLGGRKEEKAQEILMLWETSEKRVISCTKCYRQHWRTENWSSSNKTVLICLLGTNCFWIGLKREWEKAKWRQLIYSLSLNKVCSKTEQRIEWS